MQIRLRCAALLALFLCVGGNAASAAESYDNCTGFIDTVPALISTQGTWCLRHDLATGITVGAAIIIGTNNVTIDCNDFKLGGLAAGAGTMASGIRGEGRLNATIRNCSVRGFAEGIFLDIGTTGGHLVENNRLDGNRYVGITVAGDGSTVRGNRIYATGGSTIENNAAAISVFQTVNVINNTINGVAATTATNGSAAGIFSENNWGGVIVGNRVAGVLRDGTGTAYGILDFGGNDRVTIGGNQLRGSDGPGGIGITCAIDDAFAVNPRGVARDNIINGFATARLGCTDGGGNFIISSAS